MKIPKISLKSFLIILLHTAMSIYAQQLTAKDPNSKLDKFKMEHKKCNSFSDSLNNYEMIGNYVSHSKNNNFIDFKCTNAKVRIEICTEDIFRIRMSPSGIFKPNEEYVVIKYDWPTNEFSIKNDLEYIVITTKRMVIKAFKMPFRFEFFDLNGNLINRDSKEGSMGFRGDEIICKKELSEKEHFFGLGQRFDKSDLRGTKTTCLVTREYTPVPFYLATNGYGVFFHNTWASEFDFTKNPYSFSAPGGGELDYYFFYGPDFKHIISQYSKITGLSPLPPKWAFGLFYSTWDEESGGWKYRQDGQEGLLRTIKAARDFRDWPLDAIRVHSTGSNQNFYASPDTNWQNGLWGAFPNPAQLVKKLHAQKIHPLFWETPGVHKDSKMFAEGIEKNYFLTANGKAVDDIVFGFNSTPGALVDFLNPEARKWWGKYHKYMVEFGSDGVAGDFCGIGMDSIRFSKRGVFVSPSTGMKKDEFVNIYSLLFNKASWDIYKEVNPNKRSITFGLVYWAGGQRYPMQGTQDTHHANKNIFGEMMGCINLGLSGIPFRTFTDNVTRELSPSDPISRLSQYLSLTVAGERTQVTTTGNVDADRNYRYYGKLRYRLMPYIYTYAREATKTGTPLVRSLILDNQNDARTYSAFGQYLLGKNILIAPLWSDTTFFRVIYLPEGDWIEYFDEKVYRGKQNINFYAPIDRVPIFIKSGSIIPMLPDNQNHIDEITSPMTVHIYPKGITSFELYEDDGTSYDYEKGVYSITKFSCNYLNKEILIRKEAPTGNFAIPQRNHIFCVHVKSSVEEISLKGKVLKGMKSEKDLKSADEGWFQELDNKRLVWIKVKEGVKEAIQIKLRLRN